MVGMGLKGGAPLPKKKTQNSFSKYLKSLTPDKQTSTRKEFKNFAASTTPMNQRSELEPNANNFSPKDLNEAVSSNNLSKQSSESLANSPSKNTTSTVKCYQKLLSKYRSKRKLNVSEPKKTPKHIKKLRARNRTSFVDLKKRFSSLSDPAQLVQCLLF